MDTDSQSIIPKLITKQLGKIDMVTIAIKKDKKRSSI